MKMLSGIIAGLALGCAGMAAVAGVHSGMVGHGPHGAGGPLMVTQMVDWLVNESLDDLGATEAQRTRLIAVKDRITPQATHLMEAHNATHAEFKKQWDAETMDAARLHALVDARVEEMRKVLHSAVDGVVEIHDTLTPEQRRKLDERLQSMHGAM